MPYTVQCSAHDYITRPCSIFVTFDSYVPVENETDSVRYCEKYNILPENEYCNLSHQMKLYFNEKLIYWECYMLTCRKVLE